MKHLAVNHIIWTTVYSLVDLTILNILKETFPEKFE